MRKDAFRGFIKSGSGWGVRSLGGSSHEEAAKRSGGASAAAGVPGMVQDLKGGAEGGGESSSRNKRLPEQMGTSGAERPKKKGKAVKGKMVSLGQDESDSGASVLFDGT